jgi:GntR family transcriptional repressor for pyruvate dehydrogenase complex
VYVLFPLLSNHGVIMPKEFSPAVSDPLFSTVVREPTLANRITVELENMIAANHLQPGDRLPSERELARQFGVSRTVIREAVRALVAKSLLEVQSGSGTVVRSPSIESVSKSVSMLLRSGGLPVDYGKVNEVRRLLELEIAGLAAQRRTQEDLLKLESIVREMRNIQHNRERFAQNDVAFHIALAEATHNELFVVLLNSLADIMLKVRETGFAAPGAPSHAIGYHTRIFELVRAQDVTEARRVMSEHLDISERIFRTGLAIREQRDRSDGPTIG